MFFYFLCLKINCVYVLDIFSLCTLGNFACVSLLSTVVFIIKFVKTY